QGDGVLLPVWTRNQMRQPEIGGAHDHQRRNRDPGIWQLFRLVRLRFVQKLGAVTLSARLRGPSPCLSISTPEAENDQAAKHAEPRRSPGRRLEERCRDDVLNLRRA